ncbi:hypothetical protein [Gordonia terrae]|uniref:Uncharacterized protein n=2 Tax=Gordonia terrae TaxID=2055 RepID=A0AAD0NWM4_9ACTN|nr:hypothetical protein [Gordonia terrae]ANY21571.1 hypothetical protein BCM27_00885 [Gordonia terrae]AWO82300.1 hypothetical protein DLJ61_00890 [Gordonia terrae]GAB44641.1 hypothetical protein GOTRE_069_01300 [Gordonia terrae NBRC 100016]
MSNADGSPPPRPRVAVTPMRPQRPAGRAAAVRYVIVGWLVSVALVIVTVGLTLLSLNDIRSTLAADLVRAHPESGTDAARAVDISLMVGAVIAVVVVVLGLWGSARLWDSRRSGRTILTIGAAAAVAGAVAFHLTVSPSATALADIGMPVVAQWLPATAALVAVIATGIAYTRSVTASLR